MTANTRLFRITATAGTKFVEAYFFGRIIISPNVRFDGSPWRHRLVYDPKAFFLCPPRIRLDQAFAHCPKFLTAALGAGALFNSGVAVRSHKPAGDHRFGGPLPITNFLIPGRIDRRRINLLVVHSFRMELSTCAPLYPVLKSRTEGLTTLPYSPVRRAPGWVLPKQNPPRSPQLACVRPNARVQPEPGSNSFF